MMPVHCHYECEYVDVTLELFKRINLDSNYLKGLSVWIGASKHDNTSIQTSNLYSCVLSKLGINILRHDFDAILNNRVKCDALLMFTFTPGSSARAIEVVITNKFNRSSTIKDKLHVFMPGEYSEGYISRTLANYLIAGKLIHKEKIQFEQLDKDIFSKCITHLVNIVNDKREEMELIFSPKILIVTALPLEFGMMVDLLENEREDRSLGDAKSQYPHGKIGNNDVVIAMSSMGNNFSAAIATKALEKYYSIKYIFMTGIAGGIPYLEDGNEHVRLGDIVICNSKGVVQHDMGKKVIKKKTLFSKWFSSTESDFEYNFSPRPPDSTLLRNTEINVQRTGISNYKYWMYLDKLLDIKNLKFHAFLRTKEPAL